MMQNRQTLDEFRHRNHNHIVAINSKIFWRCKKTRERPFFWQYTGMNMYTHDKERMRLKGCCPLYRCVDS